MESNHRLGDTRRAGREPRLGRVCAAWPAARGPGQGAALAPGGGQAGDPLPFRSPARPRTPPCCPRPGGSLTRGASPEPGARQNFKAQTLPQSKAGPGVQLLGKRGAVHPLLQSEKNFSKLFQRKRVISFSCLELVPIATAREQLPGKSQHPTYATHVVGGSPWEGLPQLGSPQMSP